MYQNNLNNLSAGVQYLNFIQNVLPTNLASNVHGTTSGIQSKNLSNLLRKKLIYRHKNVSDRTLLI